MEPRPTKPALLRWICFLCAAGALLAICGPFLQSPLVFDDQYFFAPGTPEDFFSKGASFSPRWWVYETFAATVVFFGQELRWLRLGNLVAHLATAITLYFLIRRLLTDVDNTPGAKLGADVAAFLASAFFLLHPLAIFTQGYLTQRTTVMATLFSLLSLLMFWRGLTGVRGALWLSCLFCFIAIYAKEHAVMLPLVSGMFLVLYRRSGLSLSVPRNTVLGVLLLQTLFALLAVLQKKGVIGSVYEPMTTEVLDGGVSIEAAVLYPLSVLNQAGLFFKYLLFWILPNPAAISIDMREAFPLDFSPLSLWAGAICFVLYAAICVVFLLKGGARGLLSAALLVPWILFFTEFAAVRLQEPFVLYRSYLWMPSIFIGLALAARRLGKSLFLILGAVIALALAALSIDRLTTLSHPYLVWNEAAELVERGGDTSGTLGAYRIYYNRGQAEYNEGMQDEALADFERVIQMKPNYGYAYHQRGVIWLSRKEWDRAASDFERAIVLLPNHVKSYRGRAKALESLGKSVEARKAMEFACFLDNSFSDCK